MSCLSWSYWPGTKNDGKVLFNVDQEAKTPAMHDSDLKN